MRIADSHNHIHFHEMHDDRNDVLMRARTAGLEYQLLVGIDPQDSKAALDFAAEHADLYAAIGIHPQMAGKYTPSDVLDLAAMKTPKVVAVGETGYDLYRTPDTEPLQRELFNAHIDLARALALPLIIHDREAHAQTIATLDECGGWKQGGVMHCFSGDTVLARKVLDGGFYLSIPGVVTYKNSQMLKEVAAFAPLDRLLIETDAPYLSPVPYRGKRNEPAFLVETIKTLASLKNISEEEIGARTADNFAALFLNVSVPRGE